MRETAFILTALLLTVALVPTVAAAPDPNPTTNQWITAKFTLTYDSLTEIRLDGALDIMEYTDGKDAYSAKDVRDTFRGANRFGGATGEQFVLDLEATLRAQMEDTLAAAFPLALSRTVNSVTVDRDSLNETDGADEFEPPIKLTISADILRSLENLGLGSYDANAVSAAFQAGARVETTFRLTTLPGYETTYVITPPPGLAFASASEAGAVSADGLKLTVVRDNTLGSESLAIPVTIVLSDPTAVQFTKRDASLGVIVDLKDLDIALGKAIKGDLGEMVIDVTVLGNLAVVEVPASALDDTVQLDYLSSDGLRLLLERGLISQADLKELEKNLLDKMASGLTSALGQKVDVLGGFDAASLDAKLISTPLSSDKPVVFKATASLRQSLNPDANAQAAIALYTTTMPFTFPRVDGLDTIYTVILPKGLAVTNVETKGGTDSTGKSADGRDQFTVTPQEENAQVTVSMAVTPTFIMTKFLGVVLLVVLVLVLLIGTPIALAVRKRKGKA